MSYQEIITSIKPDLEKVREYVTQKFSTIRTGKPNPALVENVLVDSFGSKMPIKHIATISIAGGRRLRIDPWDKTHIEAIANAISKDTSFSSVSDSSGVSISMPELSEEVRKDMIRTVGQIEDSAKKTIRKHRDEAWNKIQKEQKDGEISEDEKFKGKDKLQEEIDSFNKKINELVDNKKKELQG